MLYIIKSKLGAEEPVVLRIIHELENQKGEGKGHHMPWKKLKSFEYETYL